MRRSNTAYCQTGFFPRAYLLNYLDIAYIFAYGGENKVLRILVFRPSYVLLSVHT
jgi:hypothetical protein